MPNYGGLSKGLSIFFFRHQKMVYDVTLIFLMEK